MGKCPVSYVTIMGLIPSSKHRIFLILQIIFMGLIFGCQAQPLVLSPTGDPMLNDIPPDMSASEAATLSSMEKIDDFPLYTMDYQAAYDQGFVSDLSGEIRVFSPPTWACSLFAAMGNPEEMFFGRNFDWDFSPALLLFTNPPDGYASVSMVDIAYLGFDGERAFGLTDLSLSERSRLLDAPYLPFDGMNEAGLAVGMAAVPPGRMENDLAKETIGSLMVIRKILDQAATVEEAVIILDSINIDMGDVPIHYLVADKSGKSVLVEFSWGEMMVIPNSDSWQLATNFLISETQDEPEKQCWRYALISERLREINGGLTPNQAMDLLEEVAQEGTQWSIVYGFSTGEIQVVMGQKYVKPNKLTLD